MPNDNQGKTGYTPLTIGQISALERLGAKRWQMHDKDRLYIDTKLLGLRFVRDGEEATDFHSVMNAKSTATYFIGDEQAVTDDDYLNYATNAKVWIDVLTGEPGVRVPNNPSGKGDSEEQKTRVIALYKKAAKEFAADALRPASPLNPSVSLDEHTSRESLIAYASSVIAHTIRLNAQCDEGLPPSVPQEWRELDATGGGQLNNQIMGLLDAYDTDALRAVVEESMGTALTNLINIEGSGANFIIGKVALSALSRQERKTRG